MLVFWNPKIWLEICRVSFRIGRVRFLDSSWSSACALALRSDLRFHGIRHLGSPSFRWKTWALGGPIVVAKIPGPIGITWLIEFPAPQFTGMRDLIFLVPSFVICCCVASFVQIWWCRFEELTVFFRKTTGEARVSSQDSSQHSNCESLKNRWESKGMPLEGIWICTELKIKN